MELKLYLPLAMLLVLFFHCRNMDFIPTSIPKTPYNSKWDHFVSNEEVLKRAGVEDIELKLVGNRLRWLCHTCRMDDNRSVKVLLHSEKFMDLDLLVDPIQDLRTLAKNALKCGHVLDLWKTGR